jgi:hypothetical protein
MSRTASPRRSARSGQAAAADKYDLYQRSVQTPEAEVRFFQRAYRRYHKQAPRVLREDFCGTFAVSCDWARGRDRSAIGVDLDPEPLEWGQRHNAARLPAAARERLSIHREDVRTVATPKADVIAAQNFSMFILRERAELARYCDNVLAHLNPGGIFVIDVMGGAESMNEDYEEKRDCDGFTYIFEQCRFDPISHYAKFHIHFTFPDGSALNKAFTYEWRYWVLPELMELLGERGFSKLEVFWEATDRATGEGNGIFIPRRHAEADPSWVAYLVARP